jgi:DNA-binding CsgD family transcriptional regulator
VVFIVLGVVAVPDVRSGDRDAVEGVQEPVDVVRGVVESEARADGSRQLGLAREPLRQALDLSHRCGATRLAAEVHERLRATGARPRRPYVTGADALTPGEHRVAALAASGRSNREIAQALFISLNTVESHLRSTFRKLDITNRAEIAAHLDGP